MVSKRSKKEIQQIYIWWNTIFTFDFLLCY